MKSNLVVLVALFVILLFVDCSVANLKVNASSNSGFDPKSPLALNETNGLNVIQGGSKLVSNTSKIEKGKNEGDQVGGSGEGVGVEKGMDKSNSSRQPELKKDHNVQKGVGGSNEDLKKEEDDGIKKKLGDQRSKDVDKEVGSKGDVVSSEPVKKEGSPVEECDPSNMCTDEKKKLVACLRVPGNESPNLSLLIQNKGKGRLNVTISAPDFVKLEKTRVQIQEKEDTEVKVYIGNGGTDSLITLTAGNGNCILDFKDLISRSSQEGDNSPKSTYKSFLSQSPAMALVFCAGLLIMLSAWMCIRFRQRHLLGKGPKYQKLEMELPVSSAVKSELETNDGWDNGWDDNWEDEEAPKTPLMPVTPSLSSKGLASRRLSKEGWKD